MTIAIASAVVACAAIAWWATLYLGGLWLAYAVGALAVGGAVALARLISRGHVL